MLIELKLIVLLVKKILLFLIIINVLLQIVKTKNILNVNNVSGNLGIKQYPIIKFRNNQTKEKIKDIINGRLEK